MVWLFPPFDPDATGKNKRRRISRIPMRMIAPNLVTLLALCSGLTGMRMALEGRMELAVAAILVAGVLDALDGRVARLLKSTSRFGAELDSLTDFVNFGVAPAIILYSWILKDAGSIGWIAALIYSICMVLRLARFNALLDAKDIPAWQSNFFTGVPAPAGAMVVSLPLLLHFIGVPVIEYGAPFAVIYTIMTGLLIVSRIPTFSGKKNVLRVSRSAVLPLFVLVVAFVALFASYPWAVMTALCLGYLGAIPLSWHSWRKHSRRDALKQK